MNIEYRTDGTAKLTSALGTVRHTLSGRAYSEVICDQKDVGRYTDGDPNVYTTSPRMVFTRHEVLSAIRSSMPEFYGQLVDAYQGIIELNIWWNSSNEINLADPDCIAWCSELGITQEMIDALRRVIDGSNA